MAGKSNDMPSFIVQVQKRVQKAIWTWRLWQHPRWLGGHYPPDWLPLSKVETDGSADNLSQSSASDSGFHEGQKVKIKFKGEELRLKQSYCCDWDPFLHEVTRVFNDNNITVGIIVVTIQFPLIMRNWNKIKVQCYLNQIFISNFLSFIVDATIK